MSATVHPDHYFPKAVSPGRLGSAFVLLVVRDDAEFGSHRNTTHLLLSFFFLLLLIIFLLLFFIILAS